MGCGIYAPVSGRIIKKFPNHELNKILRIFKF